MPQLAIGYVLPLFLISILYVYFSRFLSDQMTNYPRICQTDLRQLFKVGRTIPVGDQSEISFSIHQGTFSWEPVFVGFSDRTEFSSR